MFLFYKYFLYSCLVLVIVKGLVLQKGVNELRFLNFWDWLFRGKMKNNEEINNIILGSKRCYGENKVGIIKESGGY